MKELKELEVASVNGAGIREVIEIILGDCLRPH
jgi:hypothetical protein